MITFESQLKDGSNTETLLTDSSPSLGGGSTHLNWVGWYLYYFIESTENYKYHVGLAAPEIR